MLKTKPCILLSDSGFNDYTTITVVLFCCLNKNLFIERINFDSSLWEKTMDPELTSFYFEYV
jgi:hypothetical protein